MKKINAFTLSELIVVMIISTIVVSMAFIALSMVKRQVFSIQNKFSIKKELVRLEKVLNKDFNTYAIAELNSNKSLKFKNTLDSVNYKIADSYILRNQDTLRVAMSNTAYFLDGKEVKKGYVDAFYFEIEAFNNRRTFVYSEKDAAFYLNN